LTRLDLKGLDLRETGDSCTIPVKLMPRASSNSLSGVENGELKIKVQSPPVEGAANEALILFLAKKLKKAKGDLDLIKGQQSRHKVVKVRGLGAVEVMRLLCS